MKRFTGDMRIVLEFLSDEPDETCFTQKMKHARAVRELLFILSGNEKYHRLAKGLKEVSSKAELTNKAESEEGVCTVRDWIGEAWDKGISEGMEKGIQQGMEKGMQEGLRQGKLEGLSQGKLEGLKQGMISTCRDLNITFEETAAKLKEKFSLEDAEVQKNMALYW